MPGCGVISTTSDTFAPDAMAAVTGGVLIAACFESGWAPRNWSDGAFWATTAVEEHRSASKTVRMAVDLHLDCTGCRVRRVAGSVSSLDGFIQRACTAAERGTNERAFLPADDGTHACAGRSGSANDHRCPLPVATCAALHRRGVAGPGRCDHASRR